MRKSARNASAPDAPSIRRRRKASAIAPRRRRTRSTFTILISYRVNTAAQSVESPSIHLECAQQIHQKALHCESEGAAPGIRDNVKPAAHR